jgi:hypothetical protein
MENPFSKDSKIWKMVPMRRHVRWPGILLILTLGVPFYAQRPQGPRPRGLSRAISGVVADDQGQPIRGVVVQALRPIFDDSGASSLVNAGTQTFTDAEGRYRLTNLAPDIYVVAVSSGAGRRQASFATVYYPDLTEWRSAAPVNVTRASATSTDVSIPMKRMFHVSGAIDNADEPDAVVSSFYISRADDPASMIWQLPNASRQPQAAYQIDGLPAGTYDIFPSMTKRFIPG